MPAEVKILVEGYTTADAKAENRGEEKTCATISLIRDKDLAIVVDPGVLESQQILIDALKKERLALEDVDVVCITHSHIDHYRNIGMFKEFIAVQIIKDLVKICLPHKLNAKFVFEPRGGIPSEVIIRYEKNNIVETKIDLPYLLIFNRSKIISKQARISLNMLMSLWKFLISK